jgi:hypothetical protein
MGRVSNRRGVRERIRGLVPGIVGRCAATLAIALAGAGLNVASAQASRAVTWKSGAFAGYGGTTVGGVGDAAFGQWRGMPVSVATDYIGSNTWGDIENPGYAIQQWAASPSVTPDLSIAMWPSSGGSFTEAASGADNSHFVVLARNLIAAGLGGVSIRLGWEFNGTWYRWSVTTPGQAAQFAQAWRQIVTAMRSVPGAHFSFDWSPTENPGGLDPALAYPGDAYVTDIGLDVYDWNQAGPNATAPARWNALVNAKYGLGWQASFAASHGKPIAFPEWGLVAEPLNPAVAGGDDPLFVQNMFNWFGSHNTAFEDYFNADVATSGEFFGVDTGNGQFSNAAALYQRLYSGVGPTAADSMLSSLQSSWAAAISGFKLF